MEIIEYEEKYKEDVKDLLVELQEHLIEVDYWHFMLMGENYRENSFKRDMDAVNSREGKIYLAKENNEIVGMVIGTIPPKDDEDRDTNTCARNGRVLELIVSKKSRGKGTGELLLRKIEEYFKKMKCENIGIEVYGPNTRAYNFYDKHGYKPLDYIVMKKIEKD